MAHYSLFPSGMAQRSNPGHTPSTSSKMGSILGPALKTRYSSSSPSFSNPYPLVAYTGQQTSAHSYRGQPGPSRGQPGQTGQSHAKCQICKKYGHTAPRPHLLGRHRPLIGRLKLDWQPPPQFLPSKGSLRRLDTCYGRSKQSLRLHSVSWCLPASFLLETRNWTPICF